MEGTLTGIITSNQSEPGSNTYKEVLHTLALQLERQFDTADKNGVGWVLIRSKFFKYCIL